MTTNQKRKKDTHCKLFGSRMNGTVRRFFMFFIVECKLIVICVDIMFIFFYAVLDRFIIIYTRVELYEWMYVCNLCACLCVIELTNGIITSITRQTNTIVDWNKYQLWRRPHIYDTYNIHTKTNCHCAFAVCFVFAIWS